MTNNELNQLNLSFQNIATQFTNKDREIRGLCDRLTELELVISRLVVPLPADNSTFSTNERLDLGPVTVTSSTNAELTIVQNSPYYNSSTTVVGPAQTRKENLSIRQQREMNRRAIESDLRARGMPTTNIPPEMLPRAQPIHNPDSRKIEPNL